MTSTEKPVEVDTISSHRASSDTQQDGYVRMEPSDLEKVMSKHEDGDVAVTVEVTTDPNVVNWDGPNDPENPLNWPASKKWTNIAFLSAITFLTLVTLRRSGTRSHLLTAL